MTWWSFVWQSLWKFKSPYYEQTWIRLRMKELMNHTDWLIEHSVRCNCGRSILYKDAKADGWMKIEDSILRDCDIRNAMILKGTCWRCHRDKLAQEAQQDWKNGQVIVRCRDCGAMHKRRDGCPNDCHDESYG